MANPIISLEIAEADVAITKAAAEDFTGLQGVSAKVLLAETIKQIVVAYKIGLERKKPPPPPNIT